MANRHWLLWRIFFPSDNTLYSQMLHECVWPLLIGWGLLQRYLCSLGLSTVSTQIMPVWFPRADAAQEQKACRTPCWNKEILLKVAVQSGEAGGFSADWTFHCCHLLPLRSEYLLGTYEKCINPSLEVCGPSCDPAWVYTTDALPSDNH